MDGSAVRLAVGTLTRWPVRPPQRLDARTAGRAMLLAPIVGLGIGLVAAAVSAGVLAVQPGASLLAAALAVATLAVVTRGLHLDGLADTADALGSGAPPQRALEIARRGDVGPFGVVTLVLVLLIDVAAVSVIAPGGAQAAIALVIAVTGGRVALVWACRRGVRAARPDGLGAQVAGTVAPLAALAWTAALLAAGCGVMWLASDGSWRASAGAAGAVVAAVVAGGLVVRTASRRLGGVTGDVLGAVVEFGTAAALITAAATTVASGG